MNIFNEDIENEVLGTMLMNDSALNYGLSFLTADDFFEENNIILFSVIKDNVMAGKNVNPNELTMHPKIKTSHLSRLIGMCGTSSTFKDSVSALRNMFYIRSYRNAALQIQDHINNGNRPENVIAEIEKIFNKSFETRELKQLSKMNTNIAHALKQVDDYKNKRTGLKTGIKSLDDIIIGLQPGDNVIIAARPSMGKSALAAEIMRNVSREGTAVLYFSLEMMNTQIVLRLISNLSGVAYHAIRQGKINEEDCERIVNAGTALETLPIYLDDTSTITMDSLYSKAKIIKQKNNIGLIIIDHLGLIKRRKSHSVTDELGEISHAIKAMAKDFQVPVMTLSQLSRKCEERADKRPMLSDLRDCGDIEQDADIVIMLYRDDYYNDTSSKPGIIELLVRKGRECGTGYTELQFEKSKMQFREIDRHGNYLKNGEF